MTYKKPSGNRTWVRNKFLQCGRRGQCKSTRRFFYISLITYNIIRLHISSLNLRKHQNEGQCTFDKFEWQRRVFWSPTVDFWLYYVVIETGTTFGISKRWVELSCHPKYLKLKLKKLLSHIIGGSSRTQRTVRSYLHVSTRVVTCPTVIRTVKHFPSATKLTPRRKKSVVPKAQSNSEAL